MPVALAPSLAHDMVSRPKWHWRWRSVFPDTSPISRSSMSFSVDIPDLKLSTS